MLNVFYKLIGFYAKVIASIVVLVIIIGGATTYLYNGSDGDNKAPNVKFSNFEEFKNSQYKVLTRKEQKVLKDKFQKEFFEKFSLISKNISIYATATKQVVPDKDALEEGFFMIVTKFDYPLRTSYLTQLVEETNNLVEYSEAIATDKTKTTIKWIDFLDWFTADFEYQLKNNLIKDNHITITITQFEKIVISGIGLLLIIMSIIMFLLVRPDDKKNITEVNNKKEEAKEENTTEVKTQTKVDTTEGATQTKVEEDKAKEEDTTKTKVETASTAKEKTTKVVTPKTPAKPNTKK